MLVKSKITCMHRTSPEYVMHQSCSVHCYYRISFTISWTQDRQVSMPAAQGQKQGYCGSVALADGGNPEITNEFTATLSCVILKLQPVVSTDVLDLLLSGFTEQSFSMKLDLAYQ